MNDGGRYNPTSNAWAPVNLTNALSARAYPTAVWTGSEMLVCGGAYDVGGGGTPVGLAGRYNPVTDTWPVMVTSGLPAGRVYHTTLWTGNEMIFWGGMSNSSGLIGGRYNPIVDIWTAINSASIAPANRRMHTAVWTGSDMIIWGGTTPGGTTYLNDMWSYSPSKVMFLYQKL